MIFSVSQTRNGGEISTKKITRRIAGLWKAFRAREETRRRVGRGSRGAERVRERVQLFIDVPIFDLSVTLAFPYIPVFPIRRNGAEIPGEPTRGNDVINIRERAPEIILVFPRRDGYSGPVDRNGRGNLLKPSINSRWPAAGY